MKCFEVGLVVDHSVAELFHQPIMVGQPRHVVRPAFGALLPNMLANLYG